MINYLFQETLLKIYKNNRKSTKFLIPKPNSQLIMQLVDHHLGGVVDLEEAPDFAADLGNLFLKKSKEKYFFKINFRKIHIKKQKPPNHQSNQNVADKRHHLAFGRGLGEVGGELFEHVHILEEVLPLPGGEIRHCEFGV